MGGGCCAGFGGHCGVKGHDSGGDGVTAEALLEEQAGGFGGQLTDGCSAWWVALQKLRQPSFHGAVIVVADECDGQFAVMGMNSVTLCTMGAKGGLGCLIENNYVFSKSL